MYTKSKTKAEKDWLETVLKVVEQTPFMSMIYGEYWTGGKVDIHHIWGAQTKKKYNFETVKIGEYAILPIPNELHDVHSNYALNITHHKKAFEQHFGTQKEIFSLLVDMAEDFGFTVPPDNVLAAIKNY